MKLFLVLNLFQKNEGILSIGEGLKEIVVKYKDGIQFGSYLTYTWAIRGEQASDSVQKASVSDDGKSIILTLASTLSTAGTYSLAYSVRGTWTTTLPEGIFLLGPNEEPSLEMIYSFTLV